MVLGALLAAGASPEWLRALPRRLGCPDVTINSSSVDRCGIQAIKVTVVLPDGSHEEPSEVVTQHDHQHHHSDDPDQEPASPGHRHIGELIEMIERADLSPWVRERAVRAFELLGEAEGRVHGSPADRVPCTRWVERTRYSMSSPESRVSKQPGISSIYNCPDAVGPVGDMPRMGPSPRRRQRRQFFWKASSSGPMDR